MTRRIVIEIPDSLNWNEVDRISFRHDNGDTFETLDWITPPEIELTHSTKTTEYEYFQPAIDVLVSAIWAQMALINRAKTTVYLKNCICDVPDAKEQQKREKDIIAQGEYNIKVFKEAMKKLRGREIVR